MDDDRRESAVDSGRCDRLNRFVARRDQPARAAATAAMGAKESKEKPQIPPEHCLRPEEL